MLILNFLTRFQPMKRLIYFILIAFLSKRWFIYEISLPILYFSFIYGYASLTSRIPTILAFCTEAEKNKKFTFSCFLSLSISCIDMLYFIIYDAWIYSLLFEHQFNDTTERKKISFAYFICITNPCVYIDKHCTHFFFLISEK